MGEAQRGASRSSRLPGRCGGGFGRRCRGGLGAARGAQRGLCGAGRTIPRSEFRAGGPVVADSEQTEVAELVCHEERGNPPSRGGEDVFVHERGGSELCADSRLGQEERHRRRVGFLLVVGSGCRPRPVHGEATELVGRVEAELVRVLCGVNRLCCGLRRVRRHGLRAIRARVPHWQRGDRRAATGCAASRHESTRQPGGELCGEGAGADHTVLLGTAHPAPPPHGDRARRLPALLDAAQPTCADVEPCRQIGHGEVTSLLAANPKRRHSGSPQGEGDSSSGFSVPFVSGHEDPNLGGIEVGVQSQELVYRRVAGSAIAAHHAEPSEMYGGSSSGRTLIGFPPVSRNPYPPPLPFVIGRSCRFAREVAGADRARG